MIHITQQNSCGFNTAEQDILGRNQGQGKRKRLACAKEQNLQSYLVGENNHGCQLSCVKVEVDHRQEGISFQSIHENMRCVISYFTTS